MKTTTAVRTTACAACCGLAGVSAFLSAPTTTVSSCSSSSSRNTDTRWGNSALSSPLRLQGGANDYSNKAAVPPRASICPPPNDDDETEGASSSSSSYAAAAASGARRAGLGGSSRRGSRRHRAATLGNLDLKPAYRLFDTVPPPTSSADQQAARKGDEVNLDVDGTAPYGERRALYHTICLGNIARYYTYWTQYFVLVLKTQAEKYTYRHSSKCVRNKQTLPGKQSEFRHTPRHIIYTT